MKRFPRHTFVAAGVAAVLVGAAFVARGVSQHLPPAPAAHQPALTIAADTARREDWPLRLAANGSVAAWQEAIVGAEASGLRLVDVRVNVGDVVRRGQVLATFDAQTTQAELARLDAAAAEAEAAAAEAAANADRARSLAATGALSDQQIQHYLTAEQTARSRAVAQRAAAKVQRVKLAQTQVLAPDDGVISARSATVGAVVPAGQELFRLIRGGRIEWRAEVTSADLGRLPANTIARLTAPDGSTATGRVRKVAPTVDAGTRSGIVYVDLEPSPSLKAGMFATGEFELGRSAALTVPQSALVVRDGFSHLFVVQADGRARELKVRTGRRQGERVEVLGGIEPGTRFVHSGAGFLSDGDLVKEAAARPATPLL
jgi:RND family efflux transporter MFP subunit